MWAAAKGVVIEPDRFGNTIGTFYIPADPSVAVPDKPYCLVDVMLGCSNYAKRLLDSHVRGQPKYQFGYPHSFTLPL